MATWGGSHYLRDFQQLELSVGTETSEVLQYVMENVVLPKLQEYIEYYVYSYREKWDGRTFEFIDAWKVKVQRQGFYNNIILYIDDDELSYGFPNPFTHNLYSADGLAEVINNGWNSSNYILPPYGFPAMGARPFWNEFVDWLNKNFEKEFISECQRRGIDMVITGDLSF